MFQYPQIVYYYCDYRDHLDAGTQPGVFRGRRVFLEWGRFDKRFMCDTQKKAPQGKILVFFFQDALKSAFQIIVSTHGCTQTGHIFPKSGHFFAKSGHFFSIFKKWQGRPPPH